MRAIARVIGAFARVLFEDVFLAWAPTAVCRRYIQKRLARDVAPGRHALLLHRLALLEQRAGDLDASESAFRGLLVTNPDDPWVPIELAMILERKGRLEEARVLYLRVADREDHSEEFRQKARAEAARIEAALR